VRENFGLDANLALQLADEFARCLRDGADYHNARTDLLHTLPKGTTYEQVQGYKKFLDRCMQWRSKAKRERNEEFKNLPFAPLTTHKGDIR
jgi:hypothetical protein